MRAAYVFSMVIALCACTKDGDIDTEDSGGEDKPGVDVLGNETHDADNVNIEVLATDDDGLDVPRDLGFDPENPERLWIVNRADDSVTILFDPGTSDQESDHIVDPYAFHFMEEVSSIAFGAAGTFGTCQESLNTYDDTSQANYFMGPALWSSDLDVFGESNPDAIDYLSDLYGMYVDLGSHLDMMHDSPNCMGIAWESDNVYWVFDGYHSAIARYDFRDDHGPGFDDHDDGTIHRYVEGEVEREADVHSGMWFDESSALLYIADTGNGRIAVLDTTTGEQGSGLSAWEDYEEHYRVDDAEIWTLVQGDLESPSGLVMHDDLLFVGDYATGVIWAFDLDGNTVDWLETGRPEALMGMEFDADGNLWVVDAEADEVLRISAK